MVGLHLLMHLAGKGLQVHALYRREQSRKRAENIFRRYAGEELLKQIRWVQGDVTDIARMEEVVAGIDVIFHTAAKVSFSPARKKEVYQTNIKGTEILVNAALHEGVSYFLHVSSVAALGGAEQPKAEKSVWTWSIPSTIYAASKFLSEMEVWRGFEEGLRGAIVNPSVIISPAFYDRGIGALADRLYRRKLKFYTSGGNGFVDVADVVRIMWQLYEQNITGERFILNAGHLTFKELLDTLARYLQVPPPRYKIPEKLLRFLIKFYNPVARLTGGETVDAPMLRSLYDTDFYDNTKITRLLHCSFIPPEESLRKLADDYLRYAVSGDASKKA